MQLDAFDFELPDDLIALRPCDPREAARLLHVRSNGELSDRKVADLPDLFEPGDVLVLNDTKVIPARLTGVRTGRGDTAPKIELTLHKRIQTLQWAAFARPARKLNVGDGLAFGDLTAQVIAKQDAGEIQVQFNEDEVPFEVRLANAGVMPLPPYIASKRSPDDRDVADYQTAYAARPGAVAAPTAGLHLTPGLLERITANGVHIARLTLHVGAGTFLPVKVEDTRDHKMHAEWGEITPQTADVINRARLDGGRIIAAGTTSLRLLETAAREDGAIEAFCDDTSIFIAPGHRFRGADLLMTNFHLPKSTLFMLVSAFSGLETMQRAYSHAIETGYRFYSYGDASLLELSA